MVDLDKMDLDELRNLQSKLGKVIEEKNRQAKAEAWSRLADAYLHYVKLFGSISTTFTVDDGYEYEVEFDEGVSFSDVGNLNIPPCW